MKTAQTYDESSVRVLKGLEPVRARPGMFTRTDCPLHVIQEVIDNAADEALGGHADKIEVTLHGDGSVTVSDNGRGIPVGPHPTEKIPTVIVVFTQLHAGGKFDKDAASAYAFSGGLHGVGVSVTNALSTRLQVTVKRDAKIHEVTFVDGGEVGIPLADVGSCPRGETGTTVRVWVDAKYFDSPKLPHNDLERLLRSKAVLLPGIRVTLRIEGGEETTWCYGGGLAGYLEEMLGDSDASDEDGDVAALPVFAGEHYAGADNGGNFTLGEGAAWALAFGRSPLFTESYVNLIPTPLGGTHDSGMRAGIFEAVRTFAEHHGMLPKGVQLRQDDVCGRMSFILSTKILDPQFQGQVKDKLTSREAVRLVSSTVKDPFELWLNANVQYGKQITEMAAKAAAARLRTAQKIEKRKQGGVAVLPGKLTDCESLDINENELFLVEGDSAGGSAKMARNKETQAILPLRGKVQNSWEIDPGVLFGNKEIHDIAVALGVEPHTPESISLKTLEGLRYGKVIIMSDADVDGAHIQTLLLTLFFKHFPALIKNGHVCIAQPPLYRIDIPANGKKYPARRLYALDDAELAAIRDRAVKDGIPASAIETGRFKGLGEMNPTQLRETAMDPATRRVGTVRVEESEIDESVSLFDMLMSKGSAAARRDWMEKRGNEVDADV